MKERHLIRMNPAELHRLAAGESLVILPVSAIEQHGPHLPVGTDALIGEILLTELCKRLDAEESVFIAPPLLVGKSNEHLGFPGVLSLGRESLAPLFHANIRQLRAWGFRRLAILNTHGGNTPCLRTLAREKKVHWLDPMCPDTGMGWRELRQGLHAGEYETSLLLAAEPGDCAMELADCRWIGPGDPDALVQAEAAPVTFAWHSRDLSPSGTMGDATRATAEKGRRWIDGAVVHLLQQLHDLP